MYQSLHVTYTVASQYSLQKCLQKICNTLDELSCDLETRFSNLKRLHNSKFIAATQEALEPLLLPKFRQIKIQLVDQSQFIQRALFVFADSREQFL